MIFSVSSVVIARVHFTDTITLGSLIIGIIVILPALFAIVRGAVWRANATAAEETARVYKEGREAYQIKAERLEADKNELLVELADCKAALASEQAKPSQEVVVQLIERMDKHAADRTASAVAGVAELFEAHERRAEAREVRANARHDQTLQLFDTVGHALGEISQQINGRSHE